MDNLLDPYLPAEPYLRPAWASCLLWSVTEPEILEAFRTQTGCTWTPPRSGLDRLIDSAAGADREFVRQYVEWFNANVWGDPGG